jgi:GLPGLI family protein
MKKPILILATLLATTTFFGQDFQGQAVYESKTNMEGSLKFQGNGMPEEQMKMIEERMKKAFEKTFVLNFTAQQSLFEEKKKLDATAANTGVKISMMSSNASGKLFKDLKTKKAINATEGMDGKNYLITDDLPVYDWKILGETKKIGNYNCIKAVAIIKVTEADLKEFEDFKKKNVNTATQFFSMDEPKDKTITAWFTNDIPVANGPEKYQGLPGLILEVNYEKTTILCSKIVLNPKERTVIKMPTKGKVISEKDYEKIMVQGLENMKDGNGQIQMGTIRMGK